MGANERGVRGTGASLHASGCFRRRAPSATRKGASRRSAGNLPILARSAARLPVRAPLRRRRCPNACARCRTRPPWAKARRTPCAAGFIRGRRETPAAANRAGARLDMAAPLLALRRHHAQLSPLRRRARHGGARREPRGATTGKRSRSSANRARANRRLDASRSACSSRTPAACSSSGKSLATCRAGSCAANASRCSRSFRMRPPRSTRAGPCASCWRQALRQRGAGASASRRRRASRECRAAAGPELSRALSA